MAAAAPSHGPRICQITASVYRIPTDRPEADGTFTWDSTTLVLVEAVADSGERGLGYTYAASAAADVIREQLVPVVVGRPVDDVGAAWEAMVRAVRNVGRQGIAATAISAVDVALWDQRGCLSPQVCFLETTFEEAHLFTTRLAGAFERQVRLLPPRRLSVAEQVAVRRFRDEAEWENIGGRRRDVILPETTLDWSIVVEAQPIFRPTPLCRSLRVLPLPHVGELTSALRPPMRPSRRARARPARVRSTISSCSNSANEASRFSIRREVGFPSSVSIPCVMAIKRTPRRWSSCTLETKCGIERPQRSIFQTTIASTDRFRAAVSSRSIAGRESFVPETPRSTYSFSTVQPRA